MTRLTERRTGHLSADQHADYEEWRATAKRLRSLVAELEALGLHVAETDLRWEH